MKSALIGYTGFVGSNLAAQHLFTDLFNSKNISDIAGKEYDLVVCAGARAEKWRINQEPEVDKSEISKLIEHLKTVKAKKFVLISTVDVYKDPVAVNENTPINTEGLHPYGTHRYELEQFVRSTFNNALVVRLPGLFGSGLKKNVIFDLLHDNNVDRIHHAGSFQYYSLDHIWNDIQTALDSNVTLLNIATEPVRTDEIAAYCFDIPGFKNEPDGVTAGSYDMHTKHASLFGGSGNYISTKKQILEDIKNFVKVEKSKQ